jgi:hypothetical protein
LMAAIMPLAVKTTFSELGLMPMAWVAAALGLPMGMSAKNVSPAGTRLR